jgi:hypothetical protein
VPERITLYDVTIVHRNFTGEEGPYNAAGEFGFSVLLDDKEAEKLKKEGWNVKHREPREEGDTGYNFLPIAFKYRARDGRRLRAPRIILVSSDGKNPLGENEVNLLQDLDIVRVDLTISPYAWSNPTGEGIKAYLQTMYVTMKEDELDKKYAEKPADPPPF